VQASSFPLAAILQGNSQSQMRLRLKGQLCFLGPSMQGSFYRNTGRNLINWKEYLNFVKKNQLFIFSQKLFQVNG